MRMHSTPLDKPVTKKELNKPKISIIDQPPLDDLTKIFDWQKQPWYLIVDNVGDQGFYQCP